MTRLLLVLNVLAAGAILSTNSAALLTAISPYGNRTSSAPSPAIHEAMVPAPARTTGSATPARITVSGFVNPASTRQDSLALVTASLP
jgi:hypothetical protein